MREEIFLAGSQVYDPIALLRRDDEILVVSQRFMILMSGGEPAWPHEPFRSLSDVGWSLRAHEWHVVTPEPSGRNVRAAKTLARLLAQAPAFRTGNVQLRAKRRHAPR